MSDHLKRLRELLARAESEDRLAPVFVYGVTVEQLRALIADYDEAVEALKGALHVLRESDAADVWEEETDAVRAVLAKAGGR